MRLTRAALARPVAVAVLAAAAFVVGAYGLATLPVDYLPEITYPMVKIHAYWRGATPEEIETAVAEPLERVMSTVDHLDYLESSSIEGMYTLLVNFGYGTDVDVAYQDVMAAYGRVARQLPRDMDPPLIFKADPSQLPVLEVTVSSPERSLVWLREWAEDWLQDRLTTVPGTAGVEIVGGLRREIRVHLDPARLRGLGLTPAQVARALELANLETFAGRVTVETREIIARTMGEFESLDEIRDVAVARGGEGRLVRVRDVAAVEDAHEEVRVITRSDGSPCVKLAVLKQADANTLEVSRAVARRLGELRAEAPPDVRFGVLEDQGGYVSAAVAGVRDSAIAAALLVVLVVYLFLGRWRQVAVMLVALPLTVLANFFLMRTAGFSLNVFSLGGLVVAMGIVLDNSIVVVENVSRLAREARPRSALEGAEEVAGAILAATLTFLALFLPFLMIPGLASLLFRELVLVVAGVLVLSLVVALTVTPALSQWLRVGSGSGGGRMDVANAALARRYGALLARLLVRPWRVVAATIALFAASLLLLGRVGTEFLPRPDDGRVMVKVLLPAGTAVTETDRVLAAIEARLAGRPEVERIFTLAGGKVWGLATYEIAHEGELDIQLVSRGRRSLTTQQFVEEIRPLVRREGAPGARINVMAMKTKGIRQVGTQEVELKVKGDDLAALFGFARQAADALAQTPGLANVNISLEMSKPEYRVEVDRDRASALGLPVSDIALGLRGLVRGDVATQYREGAEYYPIRVVLPESRLRGKEDLEGLVVAERGGAPLAVRDVARVVRATGPVEIAREDQARLVLVRADSAGVSVGEASARALAAVAGLERPPGVELGLGGQAQMMSETTRSLGLVLAFAFFFAYVVLAVQFESFLQPFLIMVRVPLTLIGVVGALVVAGFPVGATVLIGVIILAGNEVNHGVVLLEFANRLRAEGRAAREAVLEAAVLRLRPILMTLATSVLGLVPLALNLGEGGDMLVPMAVAVIGGLLFSIFVTLAFLPCAYVLLPGGTPAALVQMVTAPAEGVA